MPLPLLRIRVRSPHDYRERLPTYQPSVSKSSQSQWKMMQEMYLPDPPPSRSELENTISTLRGKRATHRRVVLASQIGDIKTLRKLLWVHRRVSLNKPYNGLTPLCWAALNGHCKIVECLLDGLMEDPDIMELRMLEELSLVLRGLKKAPEKAPDPMNTVTAQQSSTFSTYSSTSTLNKSSYASTWASSSSTTSSSGRTKTANKEVRDSEGRTALMLASYGGHIDVVRALLKRGSKILSKDKNGRTVLDFARQNNSQDITDLVKNTFRERRAYELELAKEQRRLEEEHFAALLRRVAAGGNKNKQQLKRSNRKQRVMRRPRTAPSSRRRGNGKRMVQRPSTSQSTFRKYT